MKNKWSSKEAKKYITKYKKDKITEDLALRVYSTHLLGREKELVLHGGGNTSVKTITKNIFSKEIEVMHIKGSGWDMGTIDHPGLPAVELNPLKETINLKKLDDYRQQLNSKEITFYEICKKNNLQLRANNIVPCAHWVTPDIEPKRFDTRFFLAKVHSEQLGVHDGFELTESFWISPAKALEKFHQGEMNMIMPTIKSLEALTQFSSREEAFNHFKDLEDGAIPPILPKFIKKDGAWIGFLPGEDGYESI